MADWVGSLQNKPSENLAHLTFPASITWLMRTGDQINILIPFLGSEVPSNPVSLICVYCKESFRGAWDLMVHAQAAHMLNLYELGATKPDEVSQQSSHLVPFVVLFNQQTTPINTIV